MCFPKASRKGNFAIVLNLKTPSPRGIKRFFVDLPNCCHGNDCPPHAVSNSPPKSSRKLLWI